MKKIFLLIGLPLFIFSIHSCYTDENSDGINKGSITEKVMFTSKISPEEAKTQALQIHELLHSTPSVKNFTVKNKMLVSSILPIVTQTTPVNTGVRRAKGTKIDTTAYVVNFADDGYAIMAADRNIESVLAIVDHGSITESNAQEASPAGIVLDMTDELISNRLSMKKYEKPSDTLWIFDGDSSKIFLIGHPISVQYGKWELAKVVQPLLKTTWWDQPPFNDSVPLLPRKEDDLYQRAAVGCVPMAIIQLMAYHHKPDNYDWDSITNDRNFTQKSTRTVLASLTRQIGQVGSIEYGRENSSVKPEKVTNILDFYNFSHGPLINYSGYDAIKELIAQRPVFMSGFDLRKRKGRKYLVCGPTIYSYSGHAWLIDGYITMRRKITSFYYGASKPQVRYEEMDFVHCNFGWENGKRNGYYLSNAFKPCQGPVSTDPNSYNSHAPRSKEEGTQGDYQFKKQIITGIK